MLFLKGENTKRSTFWTEACVDFALWTQNSVSVSIDVLNLFTLTTGSESLWAVTTHWITIVQ